jgi:hypothetical protein
MPTIGILGIWLTGVNIRAARWAAFRYPHGIQDAITY